MTDTYGGVFDKVSSPLNTTAGKAVKTATMFNPVTAGIAAGLNVASTLLQRHRTKRAQHAENSLYNQQARQVQQEAGTAHQKTAEMGAASGMAGSSGLTTEQNKITQAASDRLNQMRLQKKAQHAQQPTGWENFLDTGIAGFMGGV